MTFGAGNRKIEAAKPFTVPASKSSGAWPELPAYETITPRGRYEFLQFSHQTRFGGFCISGGQATARTVPTGRLAIHSSIS
jgi:hypothetical protein